MIIDSSAILAILFAEEDMRRYEEAIADSSTRRMSAGTLLETYIVVDSRLGSSGVEELNALLRRASIQVVPVTIDHVHAAYLAWRRFGKGNHPAGLNFGDCFAYALSTISHEPLLFKGEDFARSDIESA